MHKMRCSIHLMLTFWRVSGDQTEAQTLEAFNANAKCISFLLFVNPTSKH